MTRGASLAAALLAAAALAVFVFGVRAGAMRDFEVYWTAAERAWNAEPLYRQADGHYQFKYLPAFAVLAAPLAWVSLETAKSVWLFLSFTLSLALVWLSIGVLPERRRPVAILYLIAVVSMGKFLGHELVLGQVNILFAVLVLCGVRLLVHERPSAAAACFVAAIVIKPYAVLFLPWLLHVAGRRAAVPIAAGLLGMLLLPALLYGAEANLELHTGWWRTVSGSTAPNLTNQDNVSFAAFTAKWLGTGTAAAISSAFLGGLALAAGVMVVLRGRERRRREPLEAAFLLTLIPLLSPQGWDYVFLIAMPAVVLFANYEDRLPRVVRILTWIAVATIGLSLFDLLGRERYAAFMAWSVITVCFCVLAFALATLRLRRLA